MNAPLVGQRVRFFDGEMGRVCRVTSHRGIVGTIYYMWATRDSGSKMEPDGFHIIDEPEPEHEKPDPIPFAVLPGCEELLGIKGRKKAGLPMRDMRW